MKRRAAPWIGVAALLGLVAFAIVLAAALPELTLTEGTPFEGHAAAKGTSYSPPSSGSGGLHAFIQFLAYAPTAVVLAAAGLYAWSMRRRGGDEESGPPVRRTRWGAIIVMLLLIPLLFVARSRMVRTLEAESSAAPAEEQVVAEERDLVRLPATIATGTGDTPQEESHAATHLLEAVLVLLVIGASATLLIATWKQRRARPKASPPQPPALEGTIDAALRGLARGRDPVGVVIECYREMMTSFARTSGVNPRALTPREFARSLESMGLGGEPLEELTSLFELVRYGRRPDDAFAPRAVSCMTKLRERLAESAAVAET